MHPRVSLHQVAFLDEPTAVFVDHCRATGIENASLVTTALARPGDYDDARRAVDAGGLRVTALNHPFAVYPNLEDDAGLATEKLLDAIELAEGAGGGIDLPHHRRAGNAELGASGRAVRRAARAMRRTGRPSRA